MRPRNDSPAPCNRRATALAALVVVLVGVQVALTVWARWEADPHGWTRRLDLVVGVASCLLSPVLLWRPVGGALGFGLLAALSPVATPVAALGVLQVAQRRAFPLALGIALGGIAAHAVQGLWQPSGGITFGWWLVLVTTAYGAMIGWGALARARRALLESLRERARRAEDEQGRRVVEARMLERTRIAREMHDVLAHRLSLLATYAGALEYRPDASPEQLSRAAGVVRSGVHQALEELREVIGVLRDEDIDGTRPEPDGHPQPVLADLPRLVEEARAAGDRVEFDHAVADPGALPAATGRTVYRLVQEGLTNARKHAPGQPVRVHLGGRPGGRLEVSVDNPLSGAGAAPRTPGSGTGLVGLAERVHLAGGRLDHERTGTAFRLGAWLPWPP